MQNDYMCKGEIAGVGIAVFGSPKLVDTTPGSLEIARAFASLATTGVWTGLYLKVVTRGADRDSEVSMRETGSGRRIGVGV